jgi:photosystem II stability/assembly factor-like uncharacterized protein
MKNTTITFVANYSKAVVATMTLLGCVAFLAAPVAFAQAGWAVGDNGTMLCTQNAGKLWQLVNGIPQVNLNAVSAGDPTHAWAVGDGGLVLTYQDNVACNQQVWAAQNPSVVDLKGVYFRNTVIGWEGWAVGGNQIIHTHNGGGDWGPDNVPMDVAQLYAVFGNDNVVWAVGIDDEGKPELLTYNPVEWIRIQVPTDALGAARAGFVAGDTGWIGGDQAAAGNPGVGVWRTATSGATWNEVYASTGVRQRYRSRLNAMAGATTADGTFHVFAAGGSDGCPVISVGTTWQCILSYRYVVVARSDPERQGIFGLSYVDAGGQKGLWAVGSGGGIGYNSDPTSPRVLRLWRAQNNPQPFGHREKLNGIAMVANPAN